MAKGVNYIADEQRDTILFQSIIYRKTQGQIAKETGFSQSAVSRTLAFYWAVNERNWEKLVQIYTSYIDRTIDPKECSLLCWAAKANQTEIPADVLDELRPKKVEEPKAETQMEELAKAEPTNANIPVDKIIEQNEQILACLRALVDGLPQTLTAVQYIDKRIKDEFAGNFGPLMGYVKSINENLVGVKCNTRLLKNLEVR